MHLFVRLLVRSRRVGGGGVRGVQTNPLWKSIMENRKTQTVDFQLLANSERMENKL